MDNFFNYITKPISPEDVDLWFRVNNIIPEKLELFSDFSHSLNILICETYLGEETKSNETKIVLSTENNTEHFNWCWKKTIDNFKKENIIFEYGGEHQEYFKSFFEEIFYNQKEKTVRNSISNFFNDLFDLNKSFTKSDLDMISSIYKLLEKSMKK